MMLKTANVRQNRTPLIYSVTLQQRKRYTNMTTAQKHILEHIVFEARQEDGLVGTGGTSSEAESNLREAVRDYNRHVTDTIVWQNCKVRITESRWWVAFQDGENDCVGRGDNPEGALHDLNRQLKEGGK